jgi:pimeloyl-ACP methyl ester carboxylesterase
MPDADATYVLVHGGGSTARFWDRLVPRLDRPALAVDLPGRNGKPADFATLSVDDEVASVLHDVDAASIQGRVVLVAHSSGGLVVPGVVAGLGARVAGVVLNAALVPAEGGFGIDCMKPRHREGLVASVEAATRDGTTIVLPGPPADPESFRNSYGGDQLADETLTWVLDPVRCVPDTVHHYFQPVHWSQAAHVPVTYIVNERDRPIPTPTQEQMLTHVPQGAAVERLDTGHLPAVTHPEEFAALVIAAAARMV